MKEIEKRIIKKEFTYKIDRNSFQSKNAKSKKFLAVFDGLNFSKSTLEYSIQLTKDTGAFLVGIFLDEFIYSYDVSPILASYKDAEESLSQQAAKDKEKKDESVKEFERACSQAGIHYSLMARRKLGFLNRFFKRSFTKKMAYITTLPLLIIPEE